MGQGLGEVVLGLGNKTFFTTPTLAHAASKIL